jgi:hypothetical protein
MDPTHAEAMFCPEIYKEFGFFDLYQAEKQRLIAQFSAFGINLIEEFARWENAGDFFYVCHHPRARVLIDILRRALAGRYLGMDALATSSEIVVPDYFGSMEVWPVYPELAAELGFQGSMVWTRTSSPRLELLSLSEFVDANFRALDAMTSDWRRPFVAHAASLMHVYLSSSGGMPV